MHNIFYISIFIFLFSCKQKENKTELVYDYLEECNQNYYLNKGLDFQQEIEAFATLLEEEKQLENNNSESLNKLLLQIVEKSKFPKKQFIEIPEDHQILQQPPQDLFHCLSDYYAVDSLILSKTTYFELEEAVFKYISSTSEPKANRIFKIYSEYLSAETFEIDFIRHITLAQLFRWYYVCKYENISKYPVNHD